MKKIDLSVKSNLHGSSLRKRLLELQNVFGYINEQRDQAEQEYNFWKYLRDLIRAKAYLELADKDSKESDPKKKMIRTGNKGVVDSWIHVRPVEIEYEDITGEEAQDVFSLADIEKELVMSGYKLDRAEALVKELNSAIDTARSCLAYDRSELERMGG